MTSRSPFNKNMDNELLKNGFTYYDDWKWGPVSGWQSEDFFNLRLMRHHYGYWLILGRHASGENQKLNIGSSNNAKEIIEVRNALKMLW